MGLLDLFKRDTGTSRALDKHAQRVANRRAQSPDRWASIQALAEIGGADAVRALLPRFSYYVEPSTVDQEEKELAFKVIVDQGPEAMSAVTEHLARAESISWDLKVLDAVLPADQVIGHLLNLLAPMGIDYERDPQRKIQVLATFAERKDPRILEAVLRFIGDANEAVRFHAVEAILAQDTAPEHKAALQKHAENEESLRIRNLIAKL